MLFTPFSFFPTKRRNDYFDFPVSPAPPCPALPCAPAVGGKCLLCHFPLPTPISHTPQRHTPTTPFQPLKYNYLVALLWKLLLVPFFLFPSTRPIHPSCLLFVRSPPLVSLVPHALPHIFLPFPSCPPGSSVQQRARGGGIITFFLLPLHFFTHPLGSLGWLPTLLRRENLQKEAELEKKTAHLEYSQTDSNVNLLVFSARRGLRGVR